MEDKLELMLLEIKEEILESRAQSAQRFYLLMGVLLSCALGYVLSHLGEV